MAQCPDALGFKAVNIRQPPNKCAVCFTDKETDVNQLIQVRFRISPTLNDRLLSWI